MGSVSRSTIVRPGPASSAHSVQFYESDTFLCAAVARFLGEGLASGAVARVIATAEHREGFATALRRAGHDVEAALRSGRLRMLDAEQTLEQFLVDGALDLGRLDAAVAPLFADLPTSLGPMRVYGEMVDLVWARGDAPLALQLEAIWNERQRQEGFSLLCGYALGGFRGGEHSHSFAHVCDAHSEVWPTERFAGLAASSEQLRELTALQQRAASLEEELARHERTEAQLREALRTREDFLSVAGHELKTPLTALRLQLHLLAAAENEDSVGRVRRAVGTVDRLAGLVDELLDVSRLREGRWALRPAQTDLAALVEDEAQTMAEQARRVGSRLSVRADAPVRGLWDAHRLEQVVSNLLGNALKFGAGRPVELSVVEEEGRARLTVRDFGQGISPDDRARIFERFERTEAARNHAGLGLGLWVSREIVEAHGGELSVHSVPGEGATFVVDLPIEVP